VVKLRIAVAVPATGKDLGVAPQAEARLLQQRGDHVPAHSAALGTAGSGGRLATAAMLDFCAEHGITADIEVLPSARVNEALDRLRRNDVRYRFVLDMSDLD
jgi:D-arabinose 1-dehydrogenase-like Zn-dependent alcohol dehydrogenase